MYRLLPRIYRVEMAIAALKIVFLFVACPRKCYHLQSWSYQHFSFGSWWLVVQRAIPPDVIISLTPIGINATFSLI